MPETIVLVVDLVADKRLLFQELDSTTETEDDRYRIKIVWERHACIYPIRVDSLLVGNGLSLSLSLWLVILTIGDGTGPPKVSFSSGCHRDGTSHQSVMTLVLRV